MKNLALLIAILSVNIDARCQSFTNPLYIPPLLTGSTYNLTFQASSHQFYPGISTGTYGINGDYLGPTLEFTAGDTVNLTIINNLAESTTCHLHGIHLPASMDGSPHAPIPPGTSWNATFKVRNEAATYWYHPHLHMTTMPQVTKGLAGMIILRDSNESTLNLPRSYGVDDIPVILQDRKYSVSGEFLSYALGDSMLVNGVADPYVDLPQQMVRFRLLNGSNARVYNIGFSDQRNFYVIAGDGGLLNQPFITNRLMLSNGERAEIIVDLSSDATGSSVYLKSFGSEMPADVPGAITGPMGGNGPLEAMDFSMLKINVIAQTSNPVLAIPSILNNKVPLNPSMAARVRNKTISGNGMVSGMGTFFMDGTSFDPQVFNDTIMLGDVEVWNITNTSNLAHPLHLHDVQFYILGRNGAPPPAQESGLKDGFLIRTNETVSIIAAFEDYADDSIPYMYHCHNLAHEDMGMMLQFIVTAPAVSIGQHEHEASLYIYPNPSASAWYVHHDLSSEASASLVNASGQIIVAEIEKDRTGRIYISNSDLPAGIYFLQIYDSGNKYSAAVVKE
jgi:blue copper oxidase